MKQFKLTTVMAMALLMGAVLTSCLSSKEGDNKTTQNVMALLSSDGTLTQYGGGTLVPTNTVSMPSKPGIYSFGIEYDPNGWSGNKLNVTITSSFVSLDNNNLVEGDSQGNINLYDLDYSGDMSPMMFNENYILIPCIFWMENVPDETGYDKELAKHKFTLQYPKDLHNSEGILELTLKDDVSDPELERDKSSYLYQAFNLQTVITGFKALNGSLNKIRIYGYTNHKSYDPAHNNTAKNYVDVDLTPFK